MFNMDINEMRKKEKIELVKALKEEQKNLFDLQMDIEIGKEKNPIKKKNQKKLIAQLLTVIREKEIING